MRDALDIELRLPHDGKRFHCELSPETSGALKQKIDAFCVMTYGEHLPSPPVQDGPIPPQMGLTM